jgi:hypothetical protein
MAQKTVTANGQTQIDTAQYKFGSASGLFDGNGDYLQLTNDADFTFGTGDFTIDCWVKLNAVGAVQLIYDGRPSGTNGAYPALAILNTNVIFYYVNAGIRIQGTTALTTTSGWYHIAVARSGTSTKLFLNGTQEGSTWTDSTNYSSGGTGRPWIGADGVQGGTTNNFNGWIDELRVSKGTAHFTSNFTPPSSPYTYDANNVLLLHMEGSDGSTTFTDDSATTSGPANLKSYNTNLKANIKSINTNPIANVKSLNTNV